MATPLLLLAPDAVMRADLVGEKWAPIRIRLRSGRGCLLQRRPGAGPVTIDGELGAAWIHAGAIRVAFVFHFERAWRRGRA